MGLADKLKPNPFAGDTGETPPELARALDVESFAPRMAAIMEALPSARVLVPVLAHDHPGRTEDGGVAAHDAGTKDVCKQAAMLAVEAPDGRAAMPIFSSAAALKEWNAEARPVPVHTQNAAIAAVAEADSLLVLDPGSERPMLIGRPATNALATGESWSPPWDDEDLAVTLTHTLAGIPGLLGARLQPGQRAETALVIAVDGALDRDALTASLTEAQNRLADLPDLTHRIDSLELVPARAVSNTTA